MLNLSTLVFMSVETMKDPRAMAHRLMALNLPRDVLWQALALVVIVSILLAELGAILLGGLAVPSDGVMFISPLRMALIQFSLLVMMVFTIFWVGRAAGGTGRFQDGLAIIVWLQFCMVCLQVLQTAALLLVPPLAWAIGVFGLFLFLWLLTHFIAVVHGFQSLGRTFVMIIVSSFGFAFGLSLILAMIGISVPGMEQ